MKHRIQRSALGFIGVLVAYCAYAGTIVPLIDPNLGLPESSVSTPEDRAAAREMHSRYRDLFAAYFPPDHWAHQSPKVFESDQAMVLIKDYKPLGNGQYEVAPCIMLFFPEDRLSASASQKKAVILDAPQGATLQFEGELEFSQAQLGRLSQGKLRGPITIYSDMQQPGTEDDLRIVTSDVFLNSSRLWTDADVDFRLGQTHGRGSHMEIRLLPGEGSSTAFNIGGVQSLQLSRNVKMHLELGETGLLPGKRVSSTPASSFVAGASSKTPQPPVEVTCRGSFHFDFVRYVATFEDQVDVLRMNPTGPSDQLTCELLSVHFQPKQPPPGADPTVAPEKKQELGRLEPTEIVAKGQPVVVRSPSTGAHARCQHLKYDLLLRKVFLDSDTDRGGKESRGLGDDRQEENEIMLFQGANEIHARTLEYQQDEQPQGLGTLWAAGPGWLRSQPEENPDQRFEARWNEQLHLRRHEGVQVISLQGRPKLEMTGMGRLISNEVHVWLRDPPPGTPQDTAAPGNGVQPDRMLADGDVQISSPQLTGRTEKLEIWFRQLAGTPSSQIPSPLSPTGNSPAPNSAGQSPLGTFPAQGAADSNSQAGPVTAIYDIRGELVQMQVLMQGREARVSDVTVQRGVVFRETTTKPGEAPLVIRGDHLQLAGANTEALSASVTGNAATNSPAHVEARGMTLEGAAIELDRGNNLMWINGPGVMQLPMRRGLQGEILTSEQKLAVDWRQSMRFDGRTIYFRGLVLAKSEASTLRTEELDVELTQQLEFGKSGQAEAVQVHQITCRKGVDIDNQTVEENRQVSLDHLQMVDLSINQTTGKLAAQGPGWLTTVRIRTEDPLDQSNAPKPVASPPQGSEQLEYLRVDFNKGIEGNIKQREVSFLGNVRCVYGPVPTWNSVIDANDPGGLGERGVMLKSDRLNITEMPVPRSKRGTIELEVIGNALVEGRTFTALAHRMSYAQAKDLLVLEGTGRTDAQLYRETSIGAPRAHAAAGKIKYWRGTNRIEVDNARFLDLTQPPEAKKPK